METLTQVFPGPLDRGANIVRPQQRSRSLACDRRLRVRKIMKWFCWVGMMTCCRCFVYGCRYSRQGPCWTAGSPDPGLISLSVHPGPGAAAEQRCRKSKLAFLPIASTQTIRTTDKTNNQSNKRNTNNLSNKTDYTLNIHNARTPTPLAVTRTRRRSSIHPLFHPNISCIAIVFRIEMISPASPLPTFSVHLSSESTKAPLLHSANSATPSLALSDMIA
jgi:hypothetical protein